MMEEKLNKIKEKVEIKRTGKKRERKKEEKEEKEGVRWTRRRQRCLCTD